MNQEYAPYHLRSKTKSRLIVPPPELTNHSVEKDVPKDDKKTMFNSPSVITHSVLIVASILFCILTMHVVKKKRFFDLEWESMVLVSILIGGRLVSRWATTIMMFSIESKRNYFLYFLYCKRNAVQNCVWLALVLMVYECDFHEGGKKKKVPYVTEILWCLLSGNLIWLSKILFVKVLALSFRVSAFLDRIRDSLFDQYVIRTLLKEDTESEFPLHGLNDQKNMSAWNMKRLMKIVMNEPLDEKIKSDYEAKCTARRIFYKVVKPKYEGIDLEDLKRFMEKDAALKAMRLLENERAWRISDTDLQLWMVNAFRERSCLVLSLIDTKAIVKGVHQMLNVPVGILVVVIWLHIFKFSMGFMCILLSFQFLLGFFVFGNTCMETFRAIVFFFAMHPFDVGDNVEVDGVQMTVEKMNILTTVFLKYDNGHKIYYPNSDLSKKTIKNYRRSPKKNVIGKI